MSDGETGEAREARYLGHFLAGTADGLRNLGVTADEVGAWLPRDGFTADELAVITSRLRNEDPVATGPDVPAREGA